MATNAEPTSVEAELRDQVLKLQAEIEALKSQAENKMLELLARLEVKDELHAKEVATLKADIANRAKVEKMQSETIKELVDELAMPKNARVVFSKRKSQKELADEHANEIIKKYKLTDEIADMTRRFAHLITYTDNSLTRYVDRSRLAQKTILAQLTEHDYGTILRIVDNTIATYELVTGEADSPSRQDIIDDTIEHLTFIIMEGQYYFFNSGKPQVKYKNHHACRDTLSAIGFESKKHLASSGVEYFGLTGDEIDYYHDVDAITHFINAMEHHTDTLYYLVKDTATKALPKHYYIKPIFSMNKKIESFGTNEI